MFIIWKLKINGKYLFQCNFIHQSKKSAAREISSQNFLTGGMDGTVPFCKRKYLFNKGRNVIASSTHDFPLGSSIRGCHTPSLPPSSETLQSLFISYVTLQGYRLIQEDGHPPKSFWGSSRSPLPPPLKVSGSASVKSRGGEPMIDVMSKFSISLVQISIGNAEFLWWRGRGVF